MFPKITIRNLGFLQSLKDQWGAKLSESLQDVGNGVNNLAYRLGSSPSGSSITPTAPGGLRVQHLGGGLVDFAITDNSPQTTSAIHYFVEHSYTQNFTDSRVCHASPSRNGTVLLPNGTYYFKTYAQNQYGGPPSQAITTMPVKVTGSASGALFASQGSGSGTAGQSGAGFGVNVERR